MSEWHEKSSIPPANTIGSTQLKNDSVGSQHIRDGAIAYGTQIKSNVIGTHSNIFGSFTMPSYGSLGGRLIQGIAIDTDKHHLWYVDVINLSIYEIGTTNHNILGSFATPHTSPLGLTYASDHHTLWHVDDNEYIYELGTATGNAIGSFRCPDPTPYGIEYASDNHRLWYTSSDVPWNYIFQLGTLTGPGIGSTGNIIGSFRGPISNGIRELAFVPATGRIWVAYKNQGYIFEIGTTTGAVFGSIPAILPCGLTFETQTNHLWTSANRLTPHLDEIYEIGTVPEYSHIRRNAIQEFNISSDAVGSRNITDNAISYENQIKSNIIGYRELTAGLQGSIDCAHGTIHITGTVHTHVVSGSINIGNFPAIQEVSGTVQVHVLSGSLHTQNVGTIPVKRVGSFWPSVQEISGTVQSHVLSGSLNVKEAGTFIVRRSGSFWQALQPVTGTIHAMGDVAHATADAGNPLKMGGKATDYTPGHAGEQGAAAVTEGDRVNAAFNLRGELIGGVKAQYNLLTNIGTRYDSIVTTQTTGTIDSWGYRVADLGYYLTKNNAGTLLVEVYFSRDGSHFTKNMNDFLGNLRYNGAAIGAGIQEDLWFTIACQKIKVKTTASGTTGTNTITMSNPSLYMRT